MSIENALTALADAINKQTDLLKQMASAPLRAAAPTPAGSLNEESEVKGKGKKAAKKEDVQETEVPAAEDVNKALTALLAVKPPQGKEVAQSLIKKYSPETGKLGGIAVAKYPAFIAEVEKEAEALKAQSDEPETPADPLGDL